MTSREFYLERRQQMLQQFEQWSNELRKRVGEMDDASWIDVAQCDNRYSHLLPCALG